LARQSLDTLAVLDVDSEPMFLWQLYDIVIRSNRLRHICIGSVPSFINIVSKLRDYFA